MRVLKYVFDIGKIVRASLGLKGALFGLIVVFLLIRFYEPARSFLLDRGYPEMPDVPGLWPALAFMGFYLSLCFAAHAVALEHAARPGLIMRLLDPGQRYDTYVALGNRVVRLIHLEVENPSRSRTAQNVCVTLHSYQLTGDKKAVDIRQRLKVANSETEVLDLNPRGRVAFELAGVVANGGAKLEPIEERDGQTFSILPAGSGTIFVTAEAAGLPVREERYMLYIDAGGTMTIRPQHEIASGQA